LSEDDPTRQLRLGFDTRGATCLICFPSFTEQWLVPAQADVPPQKFEPFLVFEELVTTMKEGSRWISVSPSTPTIADSSPASAREMRPALGRPPS